MGNATADKVDNRTWVLPIWGQKVLMQLRDDIAGILHPGEWGFFGGSVEPGETVLDGAFRELMEEVGFRPAVLRPLLRHHMPEYSPNAVVYSFSCQLTVDFRSLTLGEGMDFDLFSLDDIQRGSKLSARLGKAFPVIPRTFVEEVFQAALAQTPHRRSDGRHADF
jgi:8-oxo-dGTP pyrophosphatase MutT (NUDIX family)